MTHSADTIAGPTGWVANGYWPAYPRIALAELSGWRYDFASEACFTRRFMPSMIAMLGSITAALCAAPILLRAEIIGGLGFVLIYILTVVFAFVAGRSRQRLIPRSMPVSSISGHRMEAFIMTDVETPNHYELAYVDRPTRTYFRKVFAQIE